MCTYFNIGLDAVISNSFETFQSSNRCLSKFVRSLIAIRTTFSRSRNFSIKNFVHSFNEYRDGKMHTVLETSQITSQPRLMVGANIPSIFGGNI